MKSRNKQKITEKPLSTIVDELGKELLEDKELDEGFLKNAAIAGLLGLATHAGLDYTSSKNTPLGQAMQQAAEQGDDYAAYHLDRLDLYADAGAHKIMTQLSNKYLGKMKDRKMDETEITEKDEKDEDDPCWSGYEQYGMKMKDGKEVPNCVPIEESVELEEQVKVSVIGGTAAKGGHMFMGDTGIDKMIALSKENPNVEYTVKSDNYGNFKPHWLKNGKFAKQTVANANYDFSKNAVRGKPKGKDVKNTIFSLTSVVTESVELDEQVGTKMKDGKEVPNRVPVSESLTEEALLAAMKDSTIAESMGISPKEARASLRSKYGYDDLAIARAQLDETTSAGSIAAVSAPIGDTKKRNMSEEENDDYQDYLEYRAEARATGQEVMPYDEWSGKTSARSRAEDRYNRALQYYDLDDPAIDDFMETSQNKMSEEEMDNKDSEFDSAWFYKTEADDVEGPFNSKKAASDSAKGREEWVKQGKDLTDGDRRLAKRAHILSSTVLESNLVSEYEKKFRKQLNESMGVSVNVNVDSDQPDSKNITVTASGEDADDLAGLLANAGLFSSSGYGEVQFQEPELEPTSSCGCGSESEMTMEEEGEYSNSPEEKYQDMEYMLNVVSGGLNREKKSYDNAEDGDNPMAVVKEDDSTVGDMDEFYSYVLDFYGPNGIYDIGATEEEVKKATEIVKNEVGNDFEGDSVDREKVRDVILDQMRSEEERKEAEKAFEPSYEELDYDKINDMMSDIRNPIQTRGDVDDDMDRMRNFNETDEVKRLAGLV